MEKVRMSPARQKPNLAGDDADGGLRPSTDCAIGLVGHQPGLLRAAGGSEDGGGGGGVMGSDGVCAEGRVAAVTWTSEPFTRLFGAAEVGGLSGGADAATVAAVAAALPSTACAILDPRRTRAARDESNSFDICTSASTCTTAVSVRTPLP